MSYKESDQFNGEIVRLDSKGFGFIKVDGYPTNVFFHLRDLRRVRFEQLREGDKVTIGEIYRKDREEKDRQGNHTGNMIESYSAKFVYLVS